jgi:hypothetical protein
MCWNCSSGKLGSWHRSSQEGYRSAWAGCEGIGSSWGQSALFASAGCRLGTPGGYAALIDAYGPSVPVPRRLRAIGERRWRVEDGGRRIRSLRPRPEASLEGHRTFTLTILTYALKLEGLDLAVLERLPPGCKPREIEPSVRAKPTGSYARRQSHSRGSAANRGGETDEQPYYRRPASKPRQAHS